MLVMHSLASHIFAGLPDAYSASEMPSRSGSTNRTLLAGHAIRIFSESEDSITISSLPEDPDIFAFDKSSRPTPCCTGTDRPARCPATARRYPQEISRTCTNVVSSASSSSSCSGHPLPAPQVKDPLPGGWARKHFRRPQHTKAERYHGKSPQYKCQPVGSYPPHLISTARPASRARQPNIQNDPGPDPFYAISFCSHGRDDVPLWAKGRDSPLSRNPTRTGEAGPFVPYLRHGRKRQVPRTTDVKPLASCLSLLTGNPPGAQRQLKGLVVPRGKGWNGYFA